MEASDAPTVDQLKDRVRRDWTDVATIEAWRRWREPFAVHTASLTDALVRAARIEPGQRVLDLASGAGEPALTLARRVGPEGRVTATDVSPGWLSVIEDAALAEGLGNIDLAVADAHALPFPDEAFDRVTSRLGVMFFADVQRALAECRRVLEPDGRVSFLVWGAPDKNMFFGAVMQALASRVELPPPSPGVPGPLRFAPAGSLSHELEQAGFREIEEERLIVPIPWPGPPEQLWQHFREIVAPLRPVIDGLSSAERDAVAAEVVAAFAASYDGTRVELTGEVVVVTALP
jgi:ubiquinone/menaquinone biosynthesis C-methylase UbiE